MTNGTVSENTTTDIAFNTLSFSFDDDGDGFTNFAELEDGSDPLLAGNPNLRKLSISHGTLHAVFETNTTHYTASVGFLLSAFTVRAAADDSNAGLTLNGAAPAPEALSA